MLMSGSKRELDSAHVYLSYTQAELDHAFDQKQWAPNMMELVANWAATSGTVRDNSHRMQVRRYGFGSNEDLQIFPAETDQAPLLVFIHGGEWKRRDNLGSAFPAMSLVPGGFNFVNLNFEAVPNVTIPEMADQVRRALVWIYRNAAEFKANADAIHLCGHSSGAHLAAVLATTRWEDYGLPADTLKSVVCLSGIYDMEPVLLSMRRAWVKLTPDEARQMSPIHHVDRIAAPITVVYGENESPEFRRQAGEFHRALLAVGKPSTIIPIRGQNHFEVMDGLHDRNSLISTTLISQRA
jgi:arylformamidase